MTKTGWFDLTINVTEETMRLLLSKQEWLFRLLNPFLCVVKLKLLLEAVIDSRFALAPAEIDPDVLYTFEEQTPGNKRKAIKLRTIDFINSSDDTRFPQQNIL